MDDLLHFEKDNCYISRWIRNEQLERDFMDVLVSSGEELTRDDERFVSSFRRTLVSSWSHSTGSYYDEETAELVGEKEALIIGKFGYSFPGAES
jgi:hypothetical protein